MIHQKNRRFQNGLCIPIEPKTLASPSGANDYYFSRIGGASWAPPFVAGLYALTCQIKKDITPENFWKLAILTSDSVKDIGNIINPERLIDYIRHH
ncbi:MAG: hypothetical protein HQK53_15900 [Oligoflexia bacterium]|nr:hypothetical protein [Oligoflexia bacterium]